MRSRIPGWLWLVAAALSCIAVSCAQAQVPDAALRYRALLTRVAQAV